MIEQTKHEVLELITVEPRDGYHLYVEFNNGEQGIVNVSSLLYGPQFEPLREEALFNQAFLDTEAGTVAWPNNADIAPVALRDLLSQQ